MTVYYFKIPGSSSFPFSTWLPIGVNAGGPAGFLADAPGVVNHTYLPGEPPPPGLPAAPPNVGLWVEKSVHQVESWLHNYWNHGLEGYLGFTP